MKEQYLLRAISVKNLLTSEALGERLRVTFHLVGKGLNVALTLSKINWGLPSWHSGKESACQCRRCKFDPWSGKIPHAVKQLSLCATSIDPMFEIPWATTTEPAYRNYRSPPCPRAHSLQQEKPPHWETHTPQLESSPHLPQLKKSLPQSNEDPAQSKVKIN